MTTNNFNTTSSILATMPDLWWVTTMSMDVDSHKYNDEIHFNLDSDTIQNTKMWWYNEESKTMLDRGYLLDWESVEDAIYRITNARAIRLWRPELQSQFAVLVERWWMSLASPIWANMWTKRGFPISCFNVDIPDSMEGITDKLWEVIMQTKTWWGTSGYFGHIRPRWSDITNNWKTSGPVSFMKFFDTAMDTVSQGGVRRWAFARYLDIDHPDIDEFMQIKDVWNPLQNLFYGVNVSNKWMQDMIDGDKDKRSIWAKVLESRQQKGLPYIFFTDNVNDNKPDVYKDKNMMINSSNLCSEIALPSSEDESFVCCLSSMNLELYDEWKDTDAIKVAIYFLDGVLEEFIDKTKDEKYLQAAHRFTKRHRAVGLGVLGWHSYLQKHMIPFEGLEAKGLTNTIFKDMQEKSLEASRELAKLYGEPEVLKWYGRRNTTLLSIAPTTSSSAILGQSSPGIEPFSSNYYKAGLAKWNFIRRNKFLKKLLQEKWQDNDAIWRKIMMDGWSVQDLNFLSSREKQVFKTFKEISQLEIIQQRAIRQKYIDQAQSLNINIPASIPVKDVNNLIIEAWKLWVKTLYYQRSQSVSKEMVNSLFTCVSCEA